MENKSNNFIQLAEIGIADTQMREAVVMGTNNAFTRRVSSMYALGEEHGERMRKQAYEAKRRVLRNLPDLLEKAEKSLTDNGFQVRWAVDGEEAIRHVLNIAQAHDVKTVAKGKSMLSEEIALNDALEASDLTVVETDLGEYILQVEGEHPSHIIAPVIHMGKDRVRQIFMDKLNMEYLEDAEDMVFFARQRLREVFLNTDMGITGGNFIIAETGSLALVMNEGNGRMVTSTPRVHIALVGIEKIVENVDDYTTLFQVLTRSGTGQKLTVYGNIINGPRKSPDDVGPDHVYVIFVDNGRSDIYGTKYAEALSCIRCGACLNACPVYRTVGGHAYGWVYAGPIGAVITPLLKGKENAKPLPFASSLCGACKEACPVDIDLPRMLLDLRHDLIEEGKGGFMWDLSMNGWEFAMKSPTVYGMSGGFARAGLSTGLDNVVPNPLKQWKKYRDFPNFAPKSFHKLWEERQKGNDQKGTGNQ